MGSTWNAGKCSPLWQRNISSASPPIHLLVDCRPQFYIPDMIKIMKGNLARWLFMRHPELKKELWGGHLWNPSYCAVTVSDRSREQVEQYIRTQKDRA